MLKLHPNFRRKELKEMTWYINRSNAAYLQEQKWKVKHSKETLKSTIMQNIQLCKQQQIRY